MEKHSHIEKKWRKNLEEEKKATGGNAEKEKEILFRMKWEKIQTKTKKNRENFFFKKNRENRPK